MSPVTFKHFLKKFLNLILLKERAPVAQRIEHRPPEPCAQVRFLPGAQI